MIDAGFTFGADSAQVCDLHQHAGEHVRLVWTSAPGVDLQRLQQGLLQPFHFFWLLQVHAVCNNRPAPRGKKR